MSPNFQVFCVFAFSAIISVNCGLIIERITDDLNRIQTDIDRQMQQFGQYFDQNRNTWFQNGFRQPEQNSFGQPTYGQETFPGFGNVGQPSYSSGNGVVSREPETEQISGSTFVNPSTSEGPNKVEISTVTSASASESTTKKEGRRIISAHSNCPPGYVADSRGRCREYS